jgi:hypothetical protein
MYVDQENYPEHGLGMDIDLEPILGLDQNIYLIPVWDLKLDLDYGLVIILYQNNILCL